MNKILKTSFEQVEKIINKHEKTKPWGDTIYFIFELCMRYN